MNRRERLENTFAGEPTDRVPVALWRHFPGDDQRAGDLARSVVDFQKTYDWDFCKVTPASSYAISDYGAQDIWEGNPEGTRRYTRRPIQRSLDWTSLRPLDPAKGALARTLEATRMITDALGDEVPVLMTIFNPLAQAKNMASDEALIRHMRTEPERIRSGLNTLTESTLRFIEALRRLPIAGIFYAIQHASYARLSEEE
jgi:uroporphyrinogen decarboxylase